MAGLCLGLALLVGCDAANDSEDAGFSRGTPEAVNAGPLHSGTISSLDGQPIVSMNAQAFLSSTYADSVRAAIASRGQAVMASFSQAAASLGPNTQYVLLSEVLDKADGINGTQGASLISTHFEILNGGDVQQYVLALSPPEPGISGFTFMAPAASVYIVMDPAVFHPDQSTGEDTYPRSVPATRLSTGEAAVVELTETGFAIKENPSGQLLVVEAVPVIDVANEAYPNYIGFGEPEPSLILPQAESGGLSFTFLSLRKLRINKSFDGGGISGKNEVQFTAQETDNYGIEFPRLNTRRFDNAFWTNNGLNPEWHTSNTLNPYQWASNRVLWFRATDVNYPNRDYSFQQGNFWTCDYMRPGPLVDGKCLRVHAPYDFPIIRLTGASTYWRAYMNEDDWKVDRLSRRAGDWQGNIRTINFSTGALQTLYTRLDANNHAIVSSDQIFDQSGIRRVNSTTVNSRTYNGAQTFTSDSNGLTYEFSKQIITISY